MRIPVITEGSDLGDEVRRMTGRRSLVRKWWEDSSCEIGSRSLAWFRCMVCTLPFVSGATELLSMILTPALLMRICSLFSSLALRQQSSSNFTYLTYLENSPAPRFTLSRSDRSISMRAILARGISCWISWIANSAFATDCEVIYTFAWLLARNLAATKPR